MKLNELSNCSSKRASDNRSSGFTLIELLVVIAIIAILAAILFPVFAQAREKARQTACLSNMKQIGLGLMMYTEDFDEGLPCGMYQHNGANGDYGMGWVGQIYPYITNGPVFNCPSDSFDPKYDPNDMKVSYAYNQWLDSNSGSTPGLTYLSRMTSPANVLVLLEVTGGFTYATANGGFTPLPNESRSPVATGYPGSTPNGAQKYATGQMSDNFSSPNFYTPGRHTGGSVYLAADGHAKWTRAENISNGGSLAAGDAPGHAAWQVICGSGDMVDSASGQTYALTFNPN
jgi:prepilin-type N-terminal cleavage/methylation domain-containing protein/prepilin-type processing-associated H-X9-DG protein